MPNAYPASASRSALFAALVLAGTASTSLAQLRICSWNVTNYTTSSSDRTSAFQTSFYGVVPAGLALAGKSMSPDVVIGQEFTSQAAVTQFRSMLNSAAGSPGDWAAAPFLDGADTDSAFFYRTSKVQYIGTTTIAIGSSDTNNQPRDTRRYDFRPIGYGTAQSVIAAYSVHLKAQGGTNDAGRRLIECQRIRNNAAGVNTNGSGSALPAGYNFIMAGDTNITSSSASEYQALVGSQADNTGRLFDPIKSPGTWNNSSTYRFIHTQDPSGAGGMDDRHDQMLISNSLQDGVGLDYIGNTNLTFSTSTWNDPNHSYRCWGNDGTSFNLALNSTSNTMVGNVIAQALKDTTDGGHLPVFADYRVPALFASSASSVAFGNVETGTAASNTFTITNNGDVNKWTAAGIANLRYTMTVTGPFTLSGAGVQQTEAPAGGGNTHTVTMNTTTVGHKTGTITITTDAPDTPSYTIALSGDVFEPAPTCVADLGHQGGLPGGDGQLDNNDFIAFISAFFASNSAADLGHQGGLPGGDGQFDNNDFIAFISAFFAGCQ
ncbi:MAG: GC-type dockerin domain-anchored protein [Phycisphaerales bacterium]